MVKSTLENVVKQPNKPTSNLTLFGSHKFGKGRYNEKMDVPEWDNPLEDGLEEKDFPNLGDNRTHNKKRSVFDKVSPQLEQN